MVKPSHLHAIPRLADIADDPQAALALPANVAASLLLQLSPTVEALRVASLRTAQAVPASDEDELLTAEEVAKIIGKSKSWIDHHRDELPRVRFVGQSPRWRRGDIRRWVAAL